MARLSPDHLVRIGVKYPRCRVGLAPVSIGALPTWPTARAGSHFQHYIRFLEFGQGSIKLRVISDFGLTAVVCLESNQSNS